MDTRRKGRIQEGRKRKKGGRMQKIKRNEE